MEKYLNAITYLGKTKEKLLLPDLKDSNIQRTVDAGTVDGIRSMLEEYSTVIKAMEGEASEALYRLHTARFKLLQYLGPSTLLV